MAISLNNQGVRTPPERGLGIRVHTFRRGLLVKFRKSPHRTEKSLRHAQKNANPRSANPIGPESTYVVPGEDAPMANPPRARKNDAGEVLPGPFPSLNETGKSYPKTGAFPGGFRQFSDSFASGLPAVFQRFSRQVRRRLDNGFPATRFPWINPQPAPAYLFIQKKLSAIPYTVSGVQTQHSGIFRKCVCDKETCQTGGNG